MTTPSPVLCDHSLPRSLDTLCVDLISSGPSKDTVELWVFDSQEDRKAAEIRLRAQGIAVKIRSAYKPLVHWVLEEADLSDAIEMTIHYPSVAQCPPNRFLLECYPVTDLVDGCMVRFCAKTEQPIGTNPMHYAVEVRRQDGQLETYEVLAPNRPTKSYSGQLCLSNCGWTRITAAEGEIVQDSAFETDLEAAYRLVGEALLAHDWPKERPCFERLTLRVEAPFWDRDLPVAHHFISTGEAMHEDLYFSALEFFNSLEGAATSGRTTMSGQFVPEIITSDVVKVRVTLEAFSTQPQLDDAQLDAANPPDLSEATQWLSPPRIKRALDDLNGADYQAASRAGRPIWATMISGPPPQVLLSAGQHPNETSAIVGALRAAERLAQANTIGFAISPLENPDGYALFRSLAQVAPQHMQHAARYTSSGADLEYSGAVPEGKIRQLGLERCAAKLHLNLHGYPAHEWTRPFSGYVPRGFEKYTIPFGFFLVLRYQPGWKALAHSILRAVTQELSAYSPLMQSNREQQARHSRYVTAPEFDLVNEIPVFSSETTEGLMPITLITEAADETIYGDDFKVAHTAQMLAVLAAVGAYIENQHLAPDPAMAAQS